MELDRLIRRQAIGEWRDVHILAALELFNKAGTISCEAFEEAIPDVSVADLWDPAAFAARQIDPRMRQELETQLIRLFDNAAATLEPLAPAHADLAAALAQEAHNIPFPTPLPAITVPTEAPAPASPGAPSGTFGRVTDTLGWLGRSAVETIGQISGQAGQLVKDHTGIHDRLRAAARMRIATAWMGDSAHERPVLSHVILMLDETANHARSMA